VIVMRCKQHETVEQVAKYATCSVVNGLTDLAHPCQALADLYTILEHRGSLRGAKLAWVGDGNNVACSLARGCARVGMSMSIASPRGYEMNEAFLGELRKETPGVVVTSTNDPTEAVTGAAAIYTDVWASMGQESEQKQRRKDFANYQVNSQLMAAAPADVLFMHCLPAKRGEEVTDEVIDGPASIVVPQAANRMHVQKGILVWLLGGC
jgi:ornithine carbamoyltransferase